MKKITCQKEYDPETATLGKNLTAGALGGSAGPEDDLF